MVELTAHPFMTVGAVFGGAIGFTSSLRNENGPIWRTTMGSAVGGSIGLLVGLYPYQAFSLLLVSDIAWSFCDNVEKTKGLKIEFPINGK